MFKIEFITPIKGDYIAIIKIGEETHLIKKLQVQQYSYSELNTVIDIAKDELNNSKYVAYM